MEEWTLAFLDSVTQDTAHSLLRFLAVSGVILLAVGLWGRKWGVEVTRIAPGAVPMTLLSIATYALVHMFTLVGVFVGTRLVDGFILRYDLLEAVDHAAYLIPVVAVGVGLVVRYRGMGFFRTYRPGKRMLIMYLLLGLAGLVAWGVIVQEATTVLHLHRSGSRPETFRSVLDTLRIPVAALGEEALFRGGVYWSFRTYFGVATGMLLSSVVFASWHLESFQGAMLSLGGGMLFAFITERCHSILPAGIVHAVFNFFVPGA